MVASGPGLAFIAYPEAIGLFPYPAAQIFGVLFFLMMVTLGMDSQFVFVDVGVTSLIDEYPLFFKQQWKKTSLTLAWCWVANRVPEFRLAPVKSEFRRNKNGTDF